VSKAASPAFLLRGAVFNLEQSGLLLRGAWLLCQNGCYAGAVVLAASALEAVGKWKALLDLRRKVVSGKNVTIEDVRKLCSDHERMQEAENLSTGMRGHSDRGIGKLMRSVHEAHPRSDQRKALEKQLEVATRAKKKRDPGDRHRHRLAAQYVDPLSDGTWRRPVAVITQELAQDYLQNVTNNYGPQCDRYVNFEIYYKEDDPELFRALSEWSGRPKFACTVWG
jgi:AbiV family abortive infection protein